MPPFKETEYSLSLSLKLPSFVNIYSKIDFTVLCLLADTEINSKIFLKPSLLPTQSTWGEDARSDVWQKNKLFSCNVYLSMHICKTLDLELRKELIKCYIWSIALCGAETWTIRPADQKVLKCGAGEGWRRSVGPIMWEMKRCYLESMSRWISYMK